MNISEYIGIGATGLFVVIGVGFYGWFNILKQTNVLLREQNDELKIANTALTTKHSENIIAIASMQTQIDDLKSIPLKELAASMKEIARSNRAIASGNVKILKTLEASATTLARDTSNAANAAETVKSDLIKHSN